MTDLPDSQARALAVAVEHSVAVSAPAGSGKTSLLSMRMLKLLALVDAPENILAITFTRKAAQEMRDRIESALENAASLTNDDVDRISDPYQRTTAQAALAVLKQSKDKNWQLEHAPSRLRITTIDGFCRELAGQLSISSQLGAATDVLTLADPAYREAAEHLIAEMDNHDSDYFKDLLAHLDNRLETLLELVVNLLKNRDQWLPLIYALKTTNEDLRQVLENNLQNWAKDLIFQAKQALDEYAPTILTLAHYASKNLSSKKPSSKNPAEKTDFTHPLCGLIDYAELPFDHADELYRFWQPLAQLFLTSTGEFRKKVDVRQGFPSATKGEQKKITQEYKQLFAAATSNLREIPELQQLLMRIIAFPARNYSDSQWRALTSLMHLLPRAVAHLKLVFQNIEKTDFTELSLAALSALQSDQATPIGERLSAQIEHILIDEFQDTSITQLQLLQALTDSWQPGDGKTLFLVGDGMQSCYGFRNANVGIFLQVRQHGLRTVKPIAADLKVNFRSTDTVINWVNFVFKQAFPQQNNIDQGAVSYSSSEAFHISATTDDDESSYVQAHGFIDADDDSDEALFICSRIKVLQKSYPKESIAILARNRNHLKSIIQQLRQQDIAFEAIDIDALKNRVLITDLVTLTRALHNLADRISWMALLRTPWCALDFFDIYHLCGITEEKQHTSTQVSLWHNLNDPDKLKKLSEDRKQSVTRFRKTIGDALQNARRQPLSRWIEATWMALGGATGITADNDIEDVYSFFSLLAEHDQGGRIADWNQFNLALDKLHATPQRGAHHVQVMTMHKAKGLEFDSVFLPGLHRISRPADPALLYWQERLQQSGTQKLKPNIIFSPIHSSWPNDEAIANRQENNEEKHADFLRSELKQRQQLEETRLLYVACTRAKKRLYLSAHLSSDPQGNIKAPSGTSMLAKIWRAIDTQFIIHSKLKEQEEKKLHKPSDFILRIPAHWQNHELNVIRENADINNAHLNIFEEFDGHNLFERQLGTIFHRILRQLVLQGLNNWTEEKCQKLKPFWTQQLLQLACTASETKIKSHLEKMIQQIHILKKNKTAQWLFNHSHEHSACELEINTINEGKVSSHIIDRTFIDEGKRWIIDYKTGQPQKKETSLYIQTERKQHQAQLERYANALSIAFPEESYPIKTALYFPFLCHLEEM